MPTKNVLIVEDNDSMLSMLVLTLNAECKLKHISVNIKTAVTLSDSTRIIRESELDLISTDLQFPSRTSGRPDTDSGFELIYEVREYYKKDTPIILLTSSKDEDLTKPQIVWGITSKQFTLVNKPHIEEWIVEMMKVLTPKKQES